MSPPKIEEFKFQLQSLQRDFICHTSLPDTTVSVSFLGVFKERAVLWNMTLATLSHCRLLSAPDSVVMAQKNYPCPFIEIREGIENVYPLRVGLDLPIIDEPVIKKAIIMIRNYKRLVIGRIEFCSENA